LLRALRLKLKQTRNASCSRAFSDPPHLLILELQPGFEIEISYCKRSICVMTVSGFRSKIRLDHHDRHLIGYNWTNAFILVVCIKIQLVPCVLPTEPHHGARINTAPWRSPPGGFHFPLHVDPNIHHLMVVINWLGHGCDARCGVPCL
jgi:hypothetical protein